MTCVAGGDKVADKVPSSMAATESTTTPAAAAPTTKTKTTTTTANVVPATEAPASGLLSTAKLLAPRVQTHYVLVGCRFVC